MKYSRCELGGRRKAEEGWVKARPKLDGNPAGEMKGRCSERGAASAQRI